MNKFKSLILIGTASLLTFGGFAASPVLADNPRNYRVGQEQLRRQPENRQQETRRQREIRRQQQIRRQQEIRREREARRQQEARQERRR